MDWKIQEILLRQSSPPFFSPSQQSIGSMNEQAPGWHLIPVSPQGSEPHGHRLPKLFVQLDHGWTLLQLCLLHLWVLPQHSWAPRQQHCPHPIWIHSTLTHSTDALNDEGGTGQWKKTLNFQPAHQTQLLFASGCKVTFDSGIILTKWGENGNVWQ